MERKKREILSADDKLEIIKYCKENGPTDTYRVYGVDPSIVNKWERQYYEYGLDGLNSINGRPKSVKKDINKNIDLLEENRKLRLELAYLKKLEALDQEKERKQIKKKQ